MCVGGIVGYGLSFIAPSIWPGEYWSWAWIVLFIGFAILGIYLGGRIENATKEKRRTERTLRILIDAREVLASGWVRSDSGTQDAKSWTQFVRGGPFYLGEQEGKKIFLQSYDDLRKPQTIRWALAEALEAIDANGAWVHPDDSSAVKWTICGALIKAHGGKFRRESYGDAASTLYAFGQEYSPIFQRAMYTYNPIDNTDNITHEHVLAEFDRATLAVVQHGVEASA